MQRLKRVLRDSSAGRKPRPSSPVEVSSESTSEALRRPAVEKNITGED